ncbi:hypothetical protein B7494_g2632 [Chlorociboria aeruginascens]|nr:hypothetical protein B7494_g2632 [Chlorociboria aeruginascens]
MPSLFSSVPVLPQNCQTRWAQMGAGTFGLEPRWTAEPDIANVELLAHKHLKLEQNAACQATFYTQGPFNKLYKIETEAGCFLRSRDHQVVERLLVLLPIFFPSGTGTSELFVLFHNDLSMQNILVDGDGEITGIIDWECVSTLLLWRASEAPVFLKGRDRNQEPKRDEYAPDNGEEDAGGITKEALDNEGMNSLYWEHQLEYELRMLRGLLSKEMEKVVDIPGYVEMEASIPEWTDIVQRNAIQADFEEAVQNCDNGWRTNKIKSWLYAMDKGQYWSLRKSFLE